MTEAAEAMGGRLRSAGVGDVSFDGVDFDSRRLTPGQLFFALEGERTDGHLFLKEAARRGAAGAVIHRDDVEVPEDLPWVRVEDTFRALHDLTRHVRQRVPERLVAITGSVGKTTTKDLLARMLSRRYRTAKSRGNFNNLYGFPLSLLNVPDDTQWMVAEMGMSTPGELGEVSRLGRPDVAVFTCVRPAHLEFFDDLDEIARAKEELLEGLAPDGLAVINASDPRVAEIGRRHAEAGGRVARYRTPGDKTADSADDSVARARNVNPAPAGEAGTRFFLEHRASPAEPWGSVDVRLALHGSYNVDNFLAAATAALAVGVPAEDVAAAASEAEPAAMRGVVRRLPGDVTVVDDAYNSNPHALARALESAAEMPGERHWAVLGDMLELGPEGARYHQEAGRNAAERGFDPVAGVGPLSRSLVEAAHRAGATVHHFDEVADAGRWAAAEVRDGDLILVKGSRGLGLEAVVAALEEARS